MTKEPAWKREVKEIFYISLTFIVFFILFTLLKIALLGQYHLGVYKMGTVIIGSLILAKVVLIFDNLPVMKKMEFIPNIFRIFLRSFIYLIGFILFTLLEHGIKEMVDGHAFGEAMQKAFQYLISRDFLLTLVIVYIVFLFFSAFWVIRTKYGPKELYQLFFIKEQGSS